VPGAQHRIVHQGHVDEEALLAGEEVYDLLLKKGAIGSNGQFKWDNDGNVEAVLEATTFLQEAERDSLDINLPKDILPSFDKMLKKGEVQRVEDLPTETTKKQKMKWGPVQPTNQNSRIDTSRNMMDKAMELEKKNNLEFPASKKMAGIMNSNPFHVLQINELDSMARNVLVILGDNSFSTYPRE
jgi:hypothetical protein